MNNNDKMTIEEMQVVGEKIISGHFELYYKVQKELGHGIPIALLASIYGSQINLISAKEPKFLEMVQVACDRQLDGKEETS